jgi:hypothetical protein
MTTEEISMISGKDSMPEVADPKASGKASHRKPTKPKQYRKTAQEVIGKQYRGIVAKLATEAKKGSITHAKLLFDLGGVQEEVKATSPRRRRRPPSLGELLLKDVEELNRNKEVTTDSDNED